MSSRFTCVAACINTSFLVLANDVWGDATVYLSLWLELFYFFCDRNAAAVDIQAWGLFGREGPMFSVLWGIYEVELLMW